MAAKLPVVVRHSQAKWSSMMQSRYIALLLALGAAAPVQSQINRPGLQLKQPSAWLSLGAASVERERADAIARARALNPLAPEVATHNP